MEEIKPNNILLTLFYITKNKRCNNQMISTGVLIKECSCDCAFTTLAVEPMFFQAYNITLFICERKEKSKLFY